MSEEVEVFCDYCRQPLTVSRTAWDTNVFYDMHKGQRLNELRLADIE
jgi:hypothetical protein